MTSSEWDGQRYMQGRGYILSRDLVEYVGIGTFPNAHQWDMPEDIMTGAL